MPLTHCITPRTWATAPPVETGLYYCQQECNVCVGGRASLSWKHRRLIRCPLMWEERLLRLKKVSNFHFPLFVFNGFCRLLFLFKHYFYGEGFCYQGATPLQNRVYSHRSRLLFPCRFYPRTNLACALRCMRCIFWWMSISRYCDVMLAIRLPVNNRIQC